MSTDPLELAQFELQLENEHTRRFLASLSDEWRNFVEESDKLCIHFLSSIQQMMTETDPHMRRLASEWVAEHAVDVAERNALVRTMRIRFMERDHSLIRLPVP